MVFELLVLVPTLLASLFCIAVKDGRVRLTGYVSVFASVITLAIAVYLLVYAPVSTTNISWFTVAGHTFNISLTSAHINMMLLALVAFISPLIMIYSLGFFEETHEHRRFYAEMNLFAASMLFFAMAANFVSLIIAWEGLGITSYLLIGFWYRKRDAAVAARESISIIIIGDVAMLAALVILLNAYGTTSFSYISAQQAGYQIYLAFALVMLAIFTKSAQFPFSGWLPKAMEGPTPVSAFLHSSTMVKAGVFLAIIFMPLLFRLGLLPVVFVIGAITAVIGVLNAISGTHIKRILAYSTLEDLGLMLMAVGLNSVMAAVLLFVTQTFYKAILFLDAGSITRANNEEYNIFKLRESGGNKLIFWTAVIGVLSIAGIFPLSGFLGKIGLEVSATNIYTYILLVLIELGTSFYIFRWIFVPMRNSRKGEILEKLKGTPLSMVIPQTILAFAVVAATSLYFFLPQYLGISNINFGYSAPIVETILVVVGASIAYYIYRKGHKIPTNKTLFAVVHSIDWINALYLVVSKLALLTSRAVEFIDYLVYLIFALCGFVAIVVGRRFRNIVSGNLNLYTAWIVIGMAILIIAMVFVL